MQFGFDLYRVPDNRWGAKVVRIPLYFALEAKSKEKEQYCTFSEWSLERFSCRIGRKQR